MVKRAKAKGAKARHRAVKPRRAVTPPVPVAGTPRLDSTILVGVGASAGGLEAFTQLVEALDPDAGLALVLVQHLSPHHASALVELLASHTAMQVMEVTHGVRIKPNHIYVIPPNVHMVLAGDSLQ